MPASDSQYRREVGVEARNVATGVAKRRREQQQRSTAHKVAWLTRLCQYSSSHHTGGQPLSLQAELAAFRREAAEQRALIAHLQSQLTMVLEATCGRPEPAAQGPVFQQPPPAPCPGGRKETGTGGGTEAPSGAAPRPGGAKGGGGANSVAELRGPLPGGGKGGSGSGNEGGTVALSKESPEKLLKGSTSKSEKKEEKYEVGENNDSITSDVNNEKYKQDIPPTSKALAGRTEHEHMDEGNYGSGLLGAWSRLQAAIASEAHNPNNSTTSSRQSSRGGGGVGGK